MAIIKELYFYPIKSFRGLRTRELVLDADGPRLDRQWMLVDEAGRFITQRQMPLLARIGLRLVDGVAIELSSQGLEPVDFGLEEVEGPEQPVTVWKDTVPAFEVSREISAWLSEVTAQKVRLMRLSATARRGFSPDFADRHVRFVDQMPLLVISSASLKGLEQKAGVTLSMARFRPNLVVDGVEEHAEDNWGQFRAGRVEFQALKPCTRCKITTVHPLTGEVGEEPLKTLAAYRRIEKGIAFGYYYAHRAPGTLRAGEALSFA